MHAFECPLVDPRFNDVSNKIIVNSTTIDIDMKMILNCYQGFENVIKLVDVGGGLGINLKLIAFKYFIRLKIIFLSLQNTCYNFTIFYDLPHVIQHAPLYKLVLIVSIFLKEK
ncbi:caffeic acid O-methyltransferase [Medicago truncatula]|uniref:Caffeic acid O-methyltransferase n=1 Tax=Medicago truncatula TaxID=3880 RepID=G7L556_MEDTR|nr:caffeic acid O-methyltransferase [Medicago truncatula]